MPGAFINEEHIKRAWSRVRAGVKIELAVASVVPPVKKVNAITRAAYLNSLASLLSLKQQLFTLACEEAKKGNDWRRVFRGRRAIFWPDANERTELGLTDFTRHEITILDPFKKKPMKVRITVDHDNRNVKDAVIVSINGHAR